MDKIMEIEVDTTVDNEELEVVKKAIVDSGIYLASYKDLENMAKMVLEEALDCGIEIKSEKKVKK